MAVRASIREREKERGEAWKGFLAFCERSVRSSWIFRGMPSPAFELKPKIGWVKVKYDADQEIRIFRNFKRRARMLIPPRPLTDWELLALAQHHGLPTRLLDWTSNPMIAAYFAISSSPTDKDAIVHSVEVEGSKVVDMENEKDPHLVDEVKFVIPPAVVPRIINQHGLFTIHPEPEKCWVPHALRYRKFVIKKDQRQYFQRRLFRFGIDASHVMPDLDGVCQTLRWQYEASIAVGSVNF